MRIVIDMQGAQNESRFRGVGRYTIDFIKQFIDQAHDRAIEVILALNGAFPDSIDPLRADFAAHISQNSIVVWDGLTQVDYQNPKNLGRRQAAELIRETFLASLHADVVLVSDLFSGAGDHSTTSVSKLHQPLTAVIFYDLIPLMYEKDYLSHTWVKEMYNEKLAHLNNSDLLLAISSFTRNEGIRHLNHTEDTIINISSASNLSLTAHSNTTPIGSAISTNLRHALNIPTSFLLYCGGADARKNLNRLITAYAAIAPNIRHNCPLVLAGKMPKSIALDLQQHSKKQGLTSNDIIFTGYVTDNELLDLYTHALGFVFPSYCEGFGLPALEAMMLDTPVIASNTSSLPEVIGNPAALFDPLSTSDMSQSMSRLIQDEHFRTELIDHARHQRTLFSWAKTAETALNAIESTIEQHLKTAKKTPYTTNDIETHSLHQMEDIVARHTFNEHELIQISAALNTAWLREETKSFLYVDISELHQHDSKSGVQRVVRSILKNLLITPPIEYTVVPVYATPTEPYKIANRWLTQLNPTSDAPTQDTPLDPRNGDFFLGLDLQHHMVIRHENYLQNLRQRGVQVHFVVYDLLPILMPHVFMPEMEAAHATWLNTIAKFDGLIAISKAVANEAAEWIAKQKITRLRPLHINWFHLGADIDGSAPSAGLPHNSNSVLHELSQRPTFLMVGTVEPRKGQRQTLEAFNQLWQNGLNVNLVIIGKKGWHIEALVKQMQHHTERGKRLFWLDGVSDEYLEKVYAASTCLIAASEGEGFGLPLIEAAQHKLPIIARDIPVFKEVAGEYAFYFEGLNSVDLSNAVQAWLKLHQQGIAPQSSQMPWLTWKESAEQLLSIVCKDSTLKPQQNG